jgi:hypothetical protein
MPELHVFGPIPLKVPEGLTRADIEFYGIDHFRPTYVADLYFNDPEVTEQNADESRPSFAGSFAIFGHDRCFGDEGHCEVHPYVRRFDDRPSHPLTRAFKRVTVTEALLRVADAEELTITVVVNISPEDEEAEAQQSRGPILSFKGLQLTTFV